MSETVGSDLWRQSVDNFGVVSFSGDALNILMWSHYAENHSGVCLEFATDSYSFDVVAAVVYKTKRPVFRPLDSDRAGLMERILLHKADIWSYEREWRYFRITEGPGAASFPSSALRSIILGAAIRPEFERVVRELVAERDEPLLVQRAKFDEQEFRAHLE